MDPHVNPATGVWDDNYYANIGKKLAGGNSGNGAFNFDFDAAAKEAYGELGSYYNELLLKSQGDVNKALSRLVEDYNTGTRYKAEDTAKAITESNKNIVNSALARGLYQKSAFDTSSSPTQGYGIPSQNIAESTDIINQSLQRFKEAEGTQLARKQVDIPQQQKEYESELEQRRRQESGQLANLRGEQALKKAQSTLF